MDTIAAIWDTIFTNPWLHGLFFGIVIATVALTLVAWSIWFERKLAGRMQNRVGPVFVGPAGLLQPLADALKLMRKDFVVPREADKALFILSPVLLMFFALASLAVIPFGPDTVIADLDLGVLWVLAFAGLMLFPLWMAGWTSNNKYALFAGMRAVAQGISYEVPMLLMALVPVIYAGSFNLQDIVRYQADHSWFIVWPPGPGIVAFVIFFIASLAEGNRIPFDIPEAESELIAGVSVEYAGMSYGLFPFTEYLHSMIASAMASVLFLGGWSGPVFPGIHWMLLKTAILFTVILWMRWTLVRFRSDQLMRACWRWLVPISVVVVCAAAVLRYFLLAGGAP